MKADVMIAEDYLDPFACVYTPGLKRVIPVATDERPQPYGVPNLEGAFWPLEH